MLASVSAFAGSAVIGSVAGSKNATIGGQELMPNTTIFSGDSLKVNEGAVAVAVGKASRVVFGRETVASFQRDTNEVSVLLSQGNLSMTHQDDNVGLKVKVGDISIVPAKGFKTLGEVSMVNDTVLVTAKDGLLHVDRNGSSIDVAKGKTLSVSTKPEKSPSPQGGGWGGNPAWHIVTAGLAGVGAVASVVALKRAGDARDNAAKADADAIAATAAANAATAAAVAADQDAVNAGCALNTHAGVSIFVPAGSLTAPGC